MNLKQLGYALKGAESVVCIQCHGIKSNPGFASVHRRHVTDSSTTAPSATISAVPERG